MNQPKMSLKKFKKYSLDSPSKEEPVNGRSQLAAQILLEE
jgi:hypothetical protein